jgi:hypothetical protein
MWSSARYVLLLFLPIYYLMSILDDESDRVSAEDTNQIIPFMPTENLISCVLYKYISTHANFFEGSLYVTNTRTAVPT